jgi:hypothetical protein
MAKSQKYKVVALRRRRKDIEKELDLELELTFPASDALQIIRDGPPALRTERRQSLVRRAK